MLRVRCRSDAGGHTARKVKPLLVHANGDHSRIDGVWQRAVNASDRWRMPRAELRAHPIMLLDADAGSGGACSLSSLGALGDLAGMAATASLAAG